MIDVSGEIKKLITKKGISAGHAARLSGIAESHLSKILNGRQKPNLDTLFAIARGLNVSIAELFGYEPHPTPIIEHKIIVSGKPIYGENIENFVPVPLLADPASLGSGLEIDENNVEGTCLIHSRALKKGGSYQAIFVKGNSMIPVLEDGDIVAVDVKERDPQKLKKKLVACHCGDFQVTVKQLIILKDKFYFKAFNAKWEEENMPILTSQKEGLILGKVVWAWKKFE